MIHDQAYASRPMTFLEFRWRLQHLAEERIGRPARAAGAAEDAAWAAAEGAADAR